MSTGNAQGSGGFTPFTPPNSASNPGAPPGNPYHGMPTGKVQHIGPAATAGVGPTPITKVNSTADPRVLWEDGLVAIIYAKDFPANSGMGRSKTRKTPAEALNAAIDDQLVTAPGAGSAHDFIKVKLADLLARPLTKPVATVMPRLPVDPSQFKPVVPKIAQSGTYKGQIIPDFPHDCTKCGGKMYQGMYSSVHPTPDGRCPADSKPEAPKRRR